MAGKKKSKKLSRLSAQPTGEAGDERPGAFRSWVRAKRPILGFVLLFAVLMAVFYGITLIDAMENRVLPGYMRLNAMAAAATMSAFGADARANGTQISASKPRAFSVDIQQGCDALEPTALFIAAVLAFPAAFRFKLPGVVVGALALAGINLLRIITLFYTGVYFPRAFEIMHVDVWQPIFVLLALTFWVTWAWWATKPRPAQADAASQNH